MFSAITGFSIEKCYQEYAILVTGLTGAITILPALWLYKKDRISRQFGRLIPIPAGEKLTFNECMVLFCMGAAFSMYLNLIVGAIQIFFDYTSYQEAMEEIMQGKSIYMMIFWIGIIAPISEELIFRWLIYLRLRDYLKIPMAAIISGCLFGIYHGNIIQFIYASILGAVFAYIFEMTGNLWSSVLLHIGANVWSLIFSEYGIWIVEKAANTMFFVLILFLIAMIKGTSYFKKKGLLRGYRAI